MTSMQPLVIYSHMAVVIFSCSPSSDSLMNIGFMITSFMVIKVSILEGGVVYVYFLFI